LSLLCDGKCDDILSSPDNFVSLLPLNTIAFCDRV
jgi:hypothetical protein